MIGHWYYRQVLTIWYELVVFILNLGIWNFVYVRNEPTWCFGGICSPHAEVGFGTSLYQQAFYACVTEDFFNNKGMFIQKIIRLCVVGVWYNKQKYNIKICCFLARFVDRQIGFTRCSWSQVSACSDYLRLAFEIKLMSVATPTHQRSNAIRLPALT